MLFGADELVTAWVATRIPGYMISPHSRALGVTHEKKLIAGVVYERYNGIHCECSIAADPGARWADRDTLAILFGYPFNQLQCEAISCVIPSSNLKSLNLCAALGFTAEALVKFAAPDGSTLVVMKMFRDQCRWLRHGEEQQEIPTGGPGSGGDGAAVDAPRPD